MYAIVRISPVLEQQPCQLGVACNGSRAVDGAFPHGSRGRMIPNLVSSFVFNRLTASFGSRRGFAAAGWRWSGWLTP